MVALGAQRTGAGYVQLAVPESAQQAVALRLLEAVTRGLPEEDGMHVAAGADEVGEMAERAGAVVLGPGLGRSDGAVEFARAVASSVDKPLVIDADGLNAHVGELESLRERPGPTVLTPHAGELARLLDVDSEEISAHRLTHARDAAERSGCVVLLKGDDTIVAAPGGPVAVSPGATAALATAGTGDVLAGIVGTLLAKGMDVLEAAAAGVRVHVYAGLVAAERWGADHVVAGDVIEGIPDAVRRRRPPR
jgi:NAD(P)H-hydrate epimerase